MCDTPHKVYQLTPDVSWGETSFYPPALLFQLSGLEVFSISGLAQAAIVLKQLCSWERKNGSWHQAVGLSEQIPMSLSNEELWENFPTRGSLGWLSFESLLCYCTAVVTVGADPQRPPTRHCLSFNACAFVLVACFTQTLIQFHAAFRWTHIQHFTHTAVITTLQSVTFFC